MEWPNQFVMPRVKIPTILAASFCVLIAIPINKLAAQDNNPGNRWGHVFVHDPVRDEILLFGGAQERGSYIGDTWVWDGSKWHRREVIGPAPRGFAAMAFHPKRGNIIIHGGRGVGNITYSDSWEWDGTRWTQISVDSDFQADHHQMVYLPQSQLLLAYGGWTGDGVSGETWQWDGEWKKLTGISPPKRASFAMCYNKATDKVEMFGGLWINGQYADIWEWDSEGWQSRGGPYDNSSLDHHAMVYDEERGAVLIFGGKNYRYVPQANSLTLEGSNVKNLNVEGPSARHSIGLTYDSKNKVSYLYGGKEYVDGEQLPLGDFWRWDGEKWERIR